jgi:hypothetical protein
MGKDKKAADPNLNDEPHSFTDTHGVITTTGNDLPGYRIVRVIGTVYGLNVTSRPFLSHIFDLTKLLRYAVATLELIS